MPKKVIALLTAFIIGFSVPLYVGEGAGAIAYITKEFGLDFIARLISRRLLTSLANGVVNTINNIGEKKGDPSFVQNWKKFLGEAKSIGENQFRAQLNYTIQKGILCNDLKGPLARAFQKSNVPFIDIGQADKNAELRQDNLLPFQTRIKCTVPDKIREAFSKDFNKGGGWQTWSRMVEPQNNILGALVISTEELSKQRDSQKESRVNETTAGQGFVGVKNACQGLGKDAQCSFLGKTVTPGQILKGGAADWLDKNSQWFVSSDELSEVIVAVLNAALNKLSNFLGPAGSLGSSGESSPPDFLPAAQRDQDTLNKNNCVDVDGNGTVNEQDCGSPQNDACGLCF